MKKSLIVQKYGGSSLALPEQIKAAALSIKKLFDAGHSLIVVVSAMGKTTDQLVDLAYKVSPTPNRRELDMLLTTGERISMALMSMALNDVSVPAISFTGSQGGIMTDEGHSNARITDVKPVRVEAEIDRGRVAVLAGFQGVSPVTKEITTLGRGGSDTTAVALAAYFKAERCEIRKDVDGVYSADPHVVQKARHLDTLHYQQLLDMTFWGAKVLHYRSVELAALLNIPVVVALAHQTGKANERQTLINGESPMYEQAGIVSVNSHNDVRWVVVEKHDMTAALQDVFAFLRTNRLPTPQLLDSEMRKQGEWAFLITAPQETLHAIETISDGHPGISIDKREVCSVTATCRGSFASALPEEIAHALSNMSVPVYKMLFSAMSISVVIDKQHRERALQVIHNLQPRAGV